MKIQGSSENMENKQGSRTSVVNIGAVVRKWINPNGTASLPSFFITLQFVFMMSTLNSCQCAGREFQSSIQHAVISPSQAMNSSHNETWQDRVLPVNSHLTWIIERKECEQLDDGCFCENKSRTATSIRCRCDNESQEAHLKPPGRGHDIKHASLFVQKERWNWKFEHCSKIVLHTDFLATVDGSHFQVEFYNISTFMFHESAFSTRGLYSSNGNQNQVSIHFSHCEIESIPTKTFPSFVHHIKFSRCNIKSLAPRFIYALNMAKVTIDGSKIKNIDSEAFYSETMIDTLTVTNSSIVSISRNGVASAINKMIWRNLEIQVLQEDALSGTVANVTLQNSSIHEVKQNGFAIKTWSKVNLLNNTFSYVARKGFDLSRYSEINPHVEIVGNRWGKVELDFISTGSIESPFITVRRNLFLQECDCDNTFASYLTKNGSRIWFHQEILNNSKCPVNEKVFGCLQETGHVNDSDMHESHLLPYESFDFLCDSQVYMCIKGVSEVDTSTEDIIPGRPQLPNRLRVLAYFIAAMGIFIIASLIITMCVFLCRRKIPRKKSPTENGPLQNLEHAQGEKTGMAKSLSGGEYADIVFKHHNPNTSGSSRPRSMLLEDVEMEDKGVQTMPTELSNEVLEGLREKLSRPDSFWDAKETIDHLYDLIQVKELSSGLSSPPDVTMCNGQSTTTSTARLLPSTSSSPVAQITSAGVSVSIGGSDSQILQISSPPSNKSSPVSDTPPPLPTSSPPSGVPLIQRYAQIKNKGKTAPLCEYADPSDSSMHIYSELTPQLLQKEKKKNGKPPVSPTSPTHDKQINSPTHSERSRDSPSKKSNCQSPSRRLLHNGPILCEYTEPKDVQTHVYAELSNNPSQPKPTEVSASSSTTNSPKKPSILHSHSNTITIAVPPPPISIPHSNSFHNSPRLLSRIKESDLSTSNPVLTTPQTPAENVHAKNLENSRNHHKLSERLKRSVSSADASRSSTMVSPFQKGKGNNGSTNGNDTQKRPLPSIPSWADKNEGKSQL